MSLTSWWLETRALLELRQTQAVVDRGPPCKRCRFFEPQLNVPPNGHNGFRLCQSHDMWPDFSCFEKPKETDGH